MPLDPKLQKFTTASPVLANYSTSDILSGTGVQTFYLMDTEDSVGVDYKLTTTTSIMSRSGQTTMAGGTDLDFDLTPFNIPQTIKGVALVNIYIRTNTPGTHQLTVRIRKWDGTTETTIVSVTTDVISAGQNLAFCFPIAVPRTDFAQGDVLRLTIETAATSGSGQWYHDPISRDFTTTGLPTNSFINIPFELNL